MLQIISTDADFSARRLSSLCEHYHLRSLGNFPRNENSTLALILAELLDGKRVNCYDSTGSCVVRLDAQIASLRKRHGWTFISSGIAYVATPGGALRKVNEYWLPEIVLRVADAIGAKQWRTAVRKTHQGMQSRYPMRKITAAKLTDQWVYALQRKS